MSDIIYINRVTGKKEIEKVYGGKALQFLYGDSFLGRLFQPVLVPLLSKFPLFSSYYGRMQKTALSKKKILPFIQKFDVDTNEFLEPVSSFQSFNDFFIRRLKNEARPIASGDDIAVIPADGRYYFFQNINNNDDFIVKGQKLNLEALLQSKELAMEYENGSLMMARLCPSDYHRFHFPCDCIPGETKFINGWLYSVNPIAIKKNIQIFSQNKRTICTLDTKAFGKVLYLEIGATNVGSIQETYTPYKPYLKGDEKGYFEFGASSLIILFPKKTIQFEDDLLRATKEGFEIRCLLGQKMGRAL